MEKACTCGAPTTTMRVAARPLRGAARVLPRCVARARPCSSGAGSGGAAPEGAKGERPPVTVTKGYGMTMKAPQDRGSLASTWSFLQRASPFVVWGETVGREAADGLPDVGELLATVAGFSGKSAGEVADYTREAHASFERYVDDLGFERRSMFEIAAKDEAQSLEDFAEGAAAARAWLAPKLALEEVDAADLEAACGEALLEAIRGGAFADATAPSDAPAPPLIARVAFGVRCVGLRNADLVPRSDGLLAAFDRLLQRWTYGTEFVRDDGSAILCREASGLFVADLRLADCARDALNEAREGGAAPDVAVKAWLGDTTLPVPGDAHGRAAGDDHASAKTMRGWLFADVVFRDATYTFAREVDRRADARWDLDWRVVDVDGAAHDHDHGKLLASFE